MDKLPYDSDRLCETIKYSFKNKSLLTEALTHSSYSHEMKIKHKDLPCNERLEFLGDSVLSIIVSEYLFSSYRDYPEGELTRLRAELVCERTLFRFATGIGLGNYLYLGVGEEKTDGRKRKSLLSDAFEAMLAAVYIDAGENGKNAVAEFLLPLVKDEIKSILRKGHTEDYKTLLQELVQRSSGGDLLEYEVTGQSGPDHKRVYTVEAHLNGNVIGSGLGNSKREAEQNAAKEALKLFGEL